MRRLTHPILLAVLGVLVLGVVVGSRGGDQQVQTGASPRATSTPAPTTTTSTVPIHPDPYVAIDRSGQPSLTIQLAEGQPDTGAFTLWVKGLGAYKGKLLTRAATDREALDIDDADPPAQSDAKPKRRVQIVTGVDGNATLIPDAGAPTTAASVRIVGFVALHRNRAAFRIWVGPAASTLDCATSPLDVARDRNDRNDRDECPRPNVTKYRIRTGDASASAAAAMIRQVGQRFERSDWDGLYTSLPPSVTGGVTRAGFVAMMQNQHIGRVTSMKTVGDGQLATAQGVSYWNQSVRLVVQPAGGPSKTYNMTMFLVFEGGQWCLLSTSTPESAS